MAVVSGQRKIADTPSNRQLNAVLVVSQMVTHTYKITSNEKILIISTIGSWISC